MTASQTGTAVHGTSRTSWIYDGSLFSTGGGANPSLTIMAVACRIGDHIAASARRGDLR